MFCSGDQDALFLQAGGVANAGHVAANSFNLKTVKITATENNACAGSGRENPERYRSSAVEPYALAFHRGGHQTVLYFCHTNSGFAHTPHAEQGSTHYFSFTGLILATDGSNSASEG